MHIVTPIVTVTPVYLLHDFHVACQGDVVPQCADHSCRQTATSDLPPPLTIAQHAQRDYSAVPDALGKSLSARHHPGTKQPDGDHQVHDDVMPRRAW